MSFADTQIRQLKAKLEPKHVKIRKANGASLHYVEGWHVIAEANRIFGYDAGDRRTIASACVWSGASGQYYAAAYTAKVRVSVRAGDITIVREGSGTGEGRAPTPGQAHERAPRLMRPNGPWRPSAIPLALRFMTGSRPVCENREATPRPPSRNCRRVLGCFALPPELRLGVTRIRSNSLKRSGLQ